MKVLLLVLCLLAVVSSFVVPLKEFSESKEPRLREKTHYSYLAWTQPKMPAILMRGKRQTAAPFWKELFNLLGKSGFIFG
uniref:Uncharacterized protein n=1 Tax=Steinernema glaseri TaxID=37863 RepID=A0A1I8AP26_9BILA